MGKTDSSKSSTAAPKKDAPTPNPAQFNAALIGTAWRVALPFLTFAFGGIGLDAWINTEPLFTIIGLVLGLIITTATVIKFVNQMYPGTIGGKK